MEKFRKYRFADVGKSELGKKETCAKHNIDRSQNGRSNNIVCIFFMLINGGTILGHIIKDIIQHAIVVLKAIAGWTDC